MSEIGSRHASLSRHVHVLLLRLLIDVLLIEGNEGFANALADCVYLGGVTTTFYADCLDWAAVDIDEASAALAVGDGHGGLLPLKALD